MFVKYLKISCAALLLCSAATASAVTMTINTDAAWAVINALQNSRLTYEEALTIADLYGNQAATRELQGFKIPATREAFAQALVAAAHGETADPVQNQYQFDKVKEKLPRLRQVLAALQDHPLLLQGAIERRIESYTPSPLNLALKGYVLAAGDGGGYTFGGTEFYINLAMIDELVVIQSVTTHELYHAVQGAFAAARKYAPAPSALTSPEMRHACTVTAELFDNIYEEGSAVEVADVSLIDDAKSEMGIKMRNELAQNVKRVKSPVILLEMSILALTGAHPLDYHDVYNVGFLGSGPLYGISYVMAKAIADSDGRQGLAGFAKRPTYEFILRYVHLPLYGKDAMHPELGAYTVAAAQRLADHCAAAPQ